MSNITCLDDTADQIASEIYKKYKITRKIEKEIARFIHDSIFSGNCPSEKWLTTALCVRFDLTDDRRLDKENR